MSATVYLEEPIGQDEDEIECEEVRIIGNIAWASPEEGEETVVPLSNVAGVEGETVEQEVEDIESLGGRYTELVTDLS